MTGTWCAVGLPVSVGGTWYHPTRVMSLTEPPYTSSPTTSMPGVPFAPADVLPIALATTELTALVGIGRATQCG
jgi:hypothetical protein